MLITRRSSLSGVERTMELPITAEEIARHAKGSLPGEAFPNLTPDQREFFLTGITPQEWDAVCEDEELAPCLTSLQIRRS